MRPYQAQWEALQTIPGIDAVAAATLLVETGINMQHFGSVQQFCSWAGMCPGQHESAGKQTHGRMRNSHMVIGTNGNWKLFND